jgi:uncharacterized protein (DUF885 family)
MKQLAALILFIPSSLLAEDAEVALPDGWAEDPPVLSTLVAFARSESDLRVAVVRYLEDWQAIERRYPVHYSPARLERLRTFYEGWQEQLRDVDFDDLNHEGKIDYIALRNRIEYDLATLALTKERGEQIASLLPFEDELRLFQERRFDRKRIDPRAAADTLDRVAKQLRELTASLEQQAAETDGMVERKGISRVVASRAAGQVQHLREVLADWNEFYDGYDPLYNFWDREPYERVHAGLKEYAQAINRHLVGVVPGETPPIIGDPVLAQGLQADLAVEMIPYTPSELLAIGEKEFEWIEAQFRIVSREMGYGDDWKAALEYTKGLAPPPGENAWAIFDIAAYSEEFIENLDNITMPPLSREIWRLAMQTPERQLINPFFSGGEVTHVSYPTEGMTHQDKLMSMRGNTPHFNFATVHHELVPGHHMQGFMSDRFNAHRAELTPTPFYSEGWSLYWELQLWDQDFPRNDPDKIGMLFWRLHRAARIIFSLNFHLGRWSPQQCVDFLVDRVGHERANAEAEVRRTTIDAPLYQIAYMIGGLQLRALYRELVESGRMSATDFHDSIMQGGRMPIELVRARLTGQSLTRDFESQWRFYGDP